MTSTVEQPVAAPPALRDLFAQARQWAAVRLRSGRELPLAGIVAAQALWLGIVYSRGWFLADDFSFLRFATTRPLDWSYLSTPFNVHFTPGVRLAYWLVAHWFGLDWAPTVVIRLVLQAACTVLLCRLLGTLGVRRRVALTVTAGYALSAGLIPASAYLGNAVNQLPSELGVLVACLAVVRWRRSGGWRWALGAGAALLLAAAFWEKAALTGGWLVLVVAAVATTGGGVRARLRQLVRDPVGWVLVFAPVAAFLAYFLSHHFGHPEKSAHLGAATLARLIWSQWSRALWPAAVGGPLHWYGGRGIYLLVADPYRWVVVVGQVAFVLLAAAGVRRAGFRSLGAWLIVLVPLAVGQLLVAAGRFAYLGDITTLDYHYVADVAPALAIAIGLAVGTSDRSVWRGGGALRDAGVRAGRLLLAAATAGALVSGWVWTDRFAASPAADYVGNLEQGVQAMPPGSYLLDVSVPVAVSSLLEPYRHVSDLLADAGERVRLGPSAGTPYSVDQAGHVGPAGFDVFARAARGAHPTKLCPRLVQGVTSATYDLHPPELAADYFLRIEYFQERPVGLRISVSDAAGHPVPVRGSAVIGATQQLAGDYVSLGLGRPAAVHVSSASPVTNICLTAVELGQPVPTAATPAP